MMNTCAIPAQNAVNRGERDVKQLCQLLQQLDSCVKNASRTTQCLATGTDQYALYRAHPAVKTPEVCARYTNVAARCRLCMDVLFGALLTAMLVCRWE
ncbi:Hypp9488 [Branchiostoma lanceolatum]|uniref:Hypp9488 protein n=1 Tax=Branchiostoma lanceolatum TaxID=7740 RepID=A0A8S4MMU0_BRALA|nr:Hypp9488 [Branchiostoma lanceolatum]